MSKFFVVTEAFVDFEWSPDVDLNELLKEFSESIFYMETLSDLEEWIAKYLMRFPDTTFIEGIGTVCPEGWHEDNAVLTYNFGYSDISAEKEN